MVFRNLAATLTLRRTADRSMRAAPRLDSSRDTPSTVKQRDGRRMDREGGKRRWGKAAPFYAM